MLPFNFFVKRPIFKSLGIAIGVDQQPIDIVALNAGIDPDDGGMEQFREDIALSIPHGILERVVAVAKPNQIQDAGDFDP